MLGATLPLHDESFALATSYISANRWDYMRWIAGGNSCSTPPCLVRYSSTGSGCGFPFDLVEQQFRAGQRHGHTVTEMPAVGIEVGEMRMAADGRDVVRRTGAEARPMSVPAGDRANPERSRARAAAGCRAPRRWWTCRSRHLPACCRPARGRRGAGSDTGLSLSRICRNGGASNLNNKICPRIGRMSMLSACSPSKRLAPRACRNDVGIRASLPCVVCSATTRSPAISNFSTSCCSRITPPSISTCRAQRAASGADCAPARHPATADRHPACHAHSGQIIGEVHMLQRKLMLRAPLRGKLSD